MAATSPPPSSRIDATANCEEPANVVADMTIGATTPMSAARASTPNETPKSGTVIAIGSAARTPGETIASGSGAGEVARRCLAQPEHRVVEHAHEPRTVAVHERLDERAADAVGPRLLEAVAEQHRRAHRRGPHAVHPAEQGRQRFAQLLLAGRARLEERELPAVERLAEVWVLVRERQALEQLGREPAAERVETRRLAPRLCSGDRQHGLDPERPPVDALEQHRAGGDGAGRREPDRSHGIADLTRRVGNALAGGELALQLDHAEAVGIAPELPRQEPPRPGPVLCKLTRCRVAHAQPFRQRELPAERQPDERSNGGVHAATAEERLLELL